MKNYFIRTLVGASFGIALATTTALPVAAQFNSGSTGADGAFNPSCAPTPCTVTVPLPNSGIFNFTTVNVPAGVTVKFGRNPANTPVTILASGDVTVVGTIDVSGQNAFLNAGGRGGSGGFDGGMGGGGVFQLGTPGLGPGGGSGGVITNFATLGGGGSFGTAGSRGQISAAGPTYGTPTLLPLIGGSGGGGSATESVTVVTSGGGGGGGAILIASSGAITLNGAIKSSGGVQDNPGLGSAGGSGGGIRLVANAITGIGSVLANGGTGINVPGGFGRIRLETFSLGITGSISPPASIGTPGPVFLPTGFPSVRIASIASVASPVPSQGTFLEPPDMTLSPTVSNPVVANLGASNVPLGTVIAVTVKTEGVAAPVTVNSTPLVGTLANSTATANLTLPNSTSVIGATATFVTP